jgi:hypothetical protein
VGVVDRLVSDRLRSTKLKQEIEAAARWWADAISGQQEQRSGAFELDLAIMAYAKSRLVGRPTAEQVEVFRINLIEFLTEKLALDCWDVTNPSRGSYWRTIAVDYDPDPTLRQAAAKAGIKIRYSETFPIKTVMWINPGCVKVALGYGAAPKVIWQEKGQSG